MGVVIFLCLNAFFTLLAAAMVVLWSARGEGALVVLWLVAAILNCVGFGIGVSDL